MLACDGIQWPIAPENLLNVLEAQHKQRPSPVFSKKHPQGWCYYRDPPGPTLLLRPQELQVSERHGIFFHLGVRDDMFFSMELISKVWKCITGWWFHFFNLSHFFHLFGEDSHSD